MHAWNTPLSKCYMCTCAQKAGMRIPSESELRPINRQLPPWDMKRVPDTVLAKCWVCCTMVHYANACNDLLVQRAAFWLPFDAKVTPNGCAAVQVFCVCFTLPFQPPKTLSNKHCVLVVTTLRTSPFLRNMSHDCNCCSTNQQTTTWCLEVNVH